MRATIAVIAALAGSAFAQTASDYATVSQISDGQVQVPTASVSAPGATEVAPTSAVETPSGTGAETPSSEVAPTSVVVPTSYAAGNGTVIAPTGGSTVVLPTASGPYSNSTATTIATSATTGEGSSATSGASSSSSSVPTGAATVNQVGSFGFAAAVAALFLA